MFAVLVLVFGITAVGETLILWHARSPVMREIALVEARHIAERAAVFSGEDRIHEQQARAYNRLIAPSTPGAKTFRVMLAAAALLAALGMTWVALMVLTQFFGGEEPIAPDRPRASIRLVGAAFVPLAVRRLLSGALTLATDPASAANVTTVAEYRELIVARFDLASLAGWNLPGIVERFAVLLTDPFGGVGAGGAGCSAPPCCCACPRGGAGADRLHRRAVGGRGRRRGRPAGHSGVRETET